MTKKYCSLTGIFVLFFFSFLVSLKGHAQIIYQNNFGTTSFSTHPYTGTPVMAARLSNATWRSSTNSWTTGNGSSGRALQINTNSGSGTMTLTFSVDNNYALDVTAFDFWTMRSNAGPRNWQMSINGINVGNGASGNGAVGRTAVSNAVTRLTGQITVVLTLTGGTGGNMRLDDFTLYGNVVSTCTGATIRSFSPASGPVGTQVKITGSGFTGTSSVKFGSTNANYTVVSDTEITVKVPAGAGSGTLSIISASACESTSTQTFSVLTPDCNGDIYISELYDAPEGSGSTGGIEIFNPLNTTVQFNGRYVIRRYTSRANANSNTGAVFGTLPNSIASRGTYLITIGNPAPCAIDRDNREDFDFGDGINEDDIIQILKDGVVIDEVLSPAYKGYTIIRRPEAIAPKPNALPPGQIAQDWIIRSENCSDLGRHTANAASGVPTVSQVFDKIVCEGTITTFSTSISGSATYQWMKLDTNDNWVAISDGTDYSGTNTATLTVLNITASMDKSQYYCAVTTSTCTVFTNAAQLIVNTSSSAQADFTLPSAICKIDSNPTPVLGTNTVRGGIFSGTPGLVINASTGEINLTASTAGPHTVTYTVTGAPTNCGGTNSKTVNISITTPAPAIAGFSLPANICKSGISPAITYDTNTVRGGAFTGSAGLFINGTTGEINLASTVAGNYQVTYTVASDPANCIQQNSETIQITINAATIPATDFTLPATICEIDNNPTASLAGTSVTGGAFSGSTGLVINATTGVINLAASTAGLHTVTYTVGADPHNCIQTGSTSKNITINTATVPVASFMLPATVCKAANNPVAQPLTNTAPGGIYSGSTGLVINSATGEIDLASSTTGNHNVTYTLTQSVVNCTAGNSETVQITINAATVPNTGFTLVSSVCKDATANPFATLSANAQTGGTFSGTPGLSINPATGEINLAASTVGDHSVTYSIAADPANCQNTGTTTLSIRISNRGVAPVTDFVIPASICKIDSNPVPVPGTTTVTGGTYTGSAGLIINSTTGVINLAASTAGQHSVTYTVAANPVNCTDTGSTTKQIIIDSAGIPTTAFTLVPEICIIDANPVANIPTGTVAGGTFSSNSPNLIINPSTGEINLTTSRAGLYNITYSVAADVANCTAAGSSTQQIRVNATTTPVTSFRYSTACKLAPNQLPLLSPGFVSGGTFTASLPDLVINPATGEIDHAASKAGNYTVTYSVGADVSVCRAAGTSARVSVTITSPAIPMANFNYNDVCGGTGVAIPVRSAGFAPGGTFSSSDARVIIDAATGAVNLATTPAGVYPVTYTITANPTRCIDANTYSGTITINNPAPAPGTIIGDNGVCINTTLQLSASENGGTWSSSNNRIATVDTNGLVTPLRTGTTTITYTVGTLCTAFAQKTISIHNLPQPIVRDIYLCEDENTGQPIPNILQCNLDNTNYTFKWYKDNTLLSSTADFCVVAEPGNYSVVATDTRTGCSNVAEATVGISSIATATAEVATDFNRYQTITVYVTGGSGSYEYSLENGPYQDEPVFSGLLDGEYTITVRDKNGCGTFELTVFALNYPRYFSANGDGRSDYWNIKGLASQYDALIYIYDRYGKLIASILPSGNGWDGTLNGAPLPATDYWFSVQYNSSNGARKEFKAHFSLLR